MKPNHAAKISKQAFSKLVEAVEAGRSKTLVEYLRAMGRFHKYSLANTMLIHFQKPDATHVAGYRNWQNLGRYVKKGEHGLAIIAPIVRRKSIGEDEQGKEPAEEIIVAFKTAYVFDIGRQPVHRYRSLPRYAANQVNTPSVLRASLPVGTSACNIGIQLARPKAYQVAAA